MQFSPKNEKTKSHIGRVGMFAATLLFALIVLALQILGWNLQQAKAATIACGSQNDVTARLLGSRPGSSIEELPVTRYMMAFNALLPPTNIPARSIEHLLAFDAPGAEHTWLAGFDARGCLSFMGVLPVNTHKSIVRSLGRAV